MGFASEFKEFALKGNVMDLAVGVIIGGAFGKIVDSLVKDLIMPIVGKIFGGLDFSNYFILLGKPPADFKGAMTYADLSKAGVPMLAYGNFITVAVNFAVLAAIIFLMVRAAGRRRRERRARRPRRPRRAALPKRMRQLPCARRHAHGPRRARRRCRHRRQPHQGLHARTRRQP